MHPHLLDLALLSHLLEHLHPLLFAARSHWAALTTWAWYQLLPLTPWRLSFECFSISTSWPDAACTRMWYHLLVQGMDSRLSLSSSLFMWVKSRISSPLARQQSCQCATLVEVNNSHLAIGTWHHDLPPTISTMTFSNCLLFFAKRSAVVAHLLELLNSTVDGHTALDIMLSFFTCH